MTDWAAFLGTNVDSIGTESERMKIQDQQYKAISKSLLKEFQEVCWNLKEFDETTQMIANHKLMLIECGRKQTQDQQDKVVSKLLPLEFHES